MALTLRLLPAADVLVTMRAAFSVKSGSGLHFHERVR
jgi:hypothetical protein